MGGIGKSGAAFSFMEDKMETLFIVLAFLGAFGAGFFCCLFLCCGVMIFNCQKKEGTHREKYSRAQHRSRNVQ